jgi:hypothetical protein
MFIVVPIIFASFFRMPFDNYEIWFVKTKSLNKNDSSNISAPTCQNVMELDRDEFEQPTVIDRELGQTANENANELEIVIEETTQQINMFAQLSE